MKRATLLTLVTLALACTNSDRASTGEPGPEPPAVEPGEPVPVVAMKAARLKALPAAVDADAQVKKWGPFFQERFSAAPDEAKTGDLNGDGKTDLVAQLDNGPYLVFDDTGVETPKRWEVLSIQPQEAPMRIAGGRLLLGTRAPVVVSWSQAQKAWAFSQAVPAGLEDATTRAKALHPEAFTPGVKKWLLGEKGFEGEANLAQHFYGDFDADGALELAVLIPGALSLWEADGEPTKTKLSYPARRAMVHLGGLKVTPFPADDETKPKQVDIKGDWLELVVPESSSQVRVFENNAWKEVWLSD